MWTIILPTLWKSNRIHQLLTDLIDEENVYEILLIDNGNEYYKHYPNGLQKVNPVIVNENIYVNPAWNLGVNLSKTEKICIIGDDANFSTELFTYITDDTLNTYGIIGMDSSCYNNPTKQFYITNCNNQERPWGWGCIILLQKKDWIDIPDELKVWYGDDFIFSHNSTPKGILYNFPIDTEMSTTSGEPEFNQIKEIDKLNYNSLWKN